MQLSIVFTLLSVLFIQDSTIQVQQLHGTWQLVNFEGIEKIRNSPQYQDADAEMRKGIDYKIQNRLENTIYEFVEGDSLKYTDFENGAIVQKTAKVAINGQNVLTIKNGKETRSAKIVEFDKNRLIIEPISDAPGSGKLEFQRSVRAVPSRSTQSQ